MIGPITPNLLLKYFSAHPYNLTEEQAKDICWNRDKYYPALQMFDRAVNNHGIEYQKSAGKDDLDNPQGILYSNAGNSYALTLCYDYKTKQLGISSIGDTLENWPNRFE